MTGIDTSFANEPSGHVFLSHDDDVVTFTTLLKLLKELIPLSLQPYGVKRFIFQTKII